MKADWFLNGLNSVYNAIEVVVFLGLGIAMLVAVGYGIARLFLLVKEKASRKKEEKEDVCRKLQELEDKLQKVEVCFNNQLKGVELTFGDFYDCLKKDEKEFSKQFERFERRIQRYEMAIDATTEFNQQRLSAAARRRKRVQ